MYNNLQARAKDTKVKRQKRNYIKAVRYWFGTSETDQYLLAKTTIKMEAKEKAIELYNLFKSKSLAISCVNKIIKSHEMWSTEQTNYYYYYEEVKKEINLL